MTGRDRPGNVTLLLPKLVYRERRRYRFAIYSKVSLRRVGSKANLFPQGEKKKSKKQQ